VEGMANEKAIYEVYEDFQEEHPEFPAAWSEYAAAPILAEDDGVYGFIFGYLLI
jgi:hypothetical protein